MLRRVLPGSAGRASKNKEVESWTIIARLCLVGRNVQKLGHVRTAGPRVLARTVITHLIGHAQGGPRHDQWAKLG